MAHATATFPRFGEIMFADLPISGSVQGGLRPVLIVQNDAGNQHSKTIEVLPLSSRVTKGSHLPTHVFIAPDSINGLRRDSVVLAENVVTIPQDLLSYHLGFASKEILEKVAKARIIQSPLPYPK